MSGLGWSLGPLSGVGTSGCPGRTHGTPGSLHRPGLCLLRRWQLPGAVARQLRPIDPRRPRVSIESPSLWAARCANTRLFAAAPGAARPTDRPQAAATTSGVARPQPLKFQGLSGGGGRSPFSTPISPPASRDSVSHSESGRWLCGTPEERGPDAALSLSRVRFHCPSFPPSLRAAPVAQAGLNLASDLPASSWGEDRRPRLSPISPP